MSFFREMERIIKDQADGGMDVIMQYAGMDIKLHRPDKDVHSDIYGALAGNRTDYVKTFVGALVGDDFFAQDDSFAGNFSEGWLYTQEKDIRSGDVLEVDSADNKVRRYKVDVPEGLGTQQTVFKRFKVTNLAD